MRATGEPKLWFADYTDSFSLVVDQVNPVPAGALQTPKRQPSSSAWDGGCGTVAGENQAITGAGQNRHEVEVESSSREASLIDIYTKMSI